MGIPYGARVSERWFLNQPGFYGGACVLAFFEDTSGQHPRPEEWCSEDCQECPHNFEPDHMLEISDYKRIQLGGPSGSGRRFRSRTAERRALVEHVVIDVLRLSPARFGNGPARSKCE